jgi:hypothetical protein
VTKTRPRKYKLFVAGQLVWQLKDKYFFRGFQSTASDGNHAWYMDVFPHLYDIAALSADIDGVPRISKEMMPRTGEI